MWISFISLFDTKYAIRPYVGGINGISGESIIGKSHTTKRRSDCVTEKQDYLVLPTQVRLDGIATEPGIVKQFIATQRIPSADQAATFLAEEISDVGFGLPEGRENSKNLGIADTSIEWQMSGKGQIGGIQLQVIPEHDIENMQFSNVPDHVLENDHLDSYYTPIPLNARSLTVLKNPSEQSILVGDTIHVKNKKEVRPQRLKIVKDLWFESPSPLTSTAGMDLEIFYQAPSARMLVIHQMDETITPVSFEVFGTRCLRSKNGLIKGFI